MAKVNVINQPFEAQLGDFLISKLSSDSFSCLHIAVAFAKNSGVLRLKKALDSFASQGHEIHAFVGIDLGGTSYEALISLFDICTSLHVVHIESDQTFHPKIYSFEGNNESLVIIGSSNMTGGGLWTNIESSAAISLDSLNDVDNVTLHQLRGYFSILEDSDFSGSMAIESVDDIDRLLNGHYVEKEMATQVKRARERKQESADKKNPDGSVERIFVSSLKAPLPKLVPTKPKKPTVTTAIISDGFEPQSDGSSNQGDATIQIISNEDYQSFWFETRALTGGSRNQVDLSMKARIVTGDPGGTEYELDEEGVMKGGVLFFGVNPEKTDEEKEITINYNGVDYFGNTIKFPDGERANGTWRLLIKGISKDNQKITDAFEREYLTHKIITFTRVESDYYYLTVFPESDLDEFIEASTVVARNGSGQNSKYFGLL